jgi:hypothetical protein
MGYYDTTAWPFAMGTHGASRGNYVFAHELAHVMGTDHNQRDQSGDLSYPYGMGKLFERGEGQYDGKHTIMAYVYTVDMYAIR